MCFHVQQIPKEKIKVGKNIIQLNTNHQNLIKNYYTVSGFAFPWLFVVSNQNPCEISLMQWGLIPFWVKTEQQAKEIRTNTLNAKCETLFSKPAFRCAAYRRCILPVNGFFEWHTIGKNKFPFFIEPKEEEYFLLAGIFDEWTNLHTGELVQTFSIVTIQANKTLAYIHNSKQRMPLILTHEMADIWLEPNVSKRDLENLFVPYNDEKMSYHTISKLITSRIENNNVPEVTAIFEYPELNL
ncbi:MAG: SOS response-associated peptidase [Bacteroidia bacterium]